MQDRCKYQETQQRKKLHFIKIFNTNKTLQNTYNTEQFYIWMVESIEIAANKTEQKLFP